MTKSENLHIKSHSRLFACSLVRSWLLFLLLLSFSVVENFFRRCVYLPKKTIPWKTDKAKQSSKITIENAVLPKICNAFLRLFAEISHFSRSVCVNVFLCYRSAVRRVKIDMNCAYFASMWLFSVRPESLYTLFMRLFTWDETETVLMKHKKPNENCTRKSLPRALSPLQKRNGIPFIIISPAYGVWLLFAW